MRLRSAEPVAALFLLCLAATPAEAQRLAFDVPAGRLSDALIALAGQAGVTIGASDPGLAAIGVRGLNGRMTLRRALALLLRGTGYGFQFVDARTVRIVRAAPAPRSPPRRAPPPPPAAPDPPSEIIVTASKQGVALDRFAGTARVIVLEGEDIGRFGVRGSAGALDRLPMLTTTSLGPGRNKIFIRGIADSSFNGSSQSVVGQYLGDVRLTFNAPNPDLELYDVERIEVLEGPQGTLYGTGALGGILRIVPNAPDPSRTAGAVTGGVLATRGGKPGVDGSAMFNLPILPGRMALRVVGYSSIDGGYIDDAGRGLRDVNRTSVSGGRATLAWQPGDGWRIELGGVAQHLAGRDGQYAERGLPPLTRRSALAQPFDIDYRLGQLTVAKRWAGIELVSASAVSRNNIETRFDATGFPGTRGPQRYTEDIAITLVSNETRLSQPDSRGAGWVAGWSVLHGTSRIMRRLGTVGAPLPLAGVRNEVAEAALFGQYSWTPSDALALTGGGRLTYSFTSGKPLDAPDDVDEPERTDLRFSPTVAVSWRPGRGILVFGRIQQGFRAGGLAVSPSGTTPSAQRTESDSLTSYELGARFGRPGRDAFAFDMTFSYARWADVQADLIDARGLPVTVNIGDGRIYGLEAEASWRITPALRLDAGVFVNESGLSSPAPAFVAADESDLPNIAAAGARAGLRFETRIAPDIGLTLDASARYVGASQLGIGAPIDIRQGDFVEGRIGGRLQLGGVGLSLDVDNVTDARGNRFALGNPFGVAARSQITPLRPRTIRLGFDAKF